MLLLFGPTHDSLDDKQPSPSLDTVSTIKFKNCQSEKTTESVSDLRPGVEDSGSECHSLFLVEDRKEEDSTREESGLGETCLIRTALLKAG